MRRAARLLLAGLRRLAVDTGGAAGVEIALWATAIIIPLLGGIDISAYAFRRMQVETAAQAAAAAAWKTCSDSTKLPAASNCNTGGALLTAMTTAAQSTSLGANVTLSGTTANDGYYCVNSSNALVLVGTANNLGTAPVKPSPFVCTTLVTGGLAVAPGEYLKVTTTYTNTNTFSAVSISSLLPSPITKTAWVKLS